MNLRSNSGPLAVLSLSLAVGSLIGCNRDDVKVYSVPKETATAPQSLPAGHPEMGGMSTGGGMAMPGDRPKLTYTTPPDWSEVAAGEMRVASFKVAKAGKQADVSVIPLGGIAGGDGANVNRWRGQIGLEAVSEEDLKKTAQTVEAAGQPAELYELLGKNPANGDPMRVLGVIQHREDVAWFFKMTGDDQLVAEQKPAFIEFLKSVKFEGPETAALSPSHPPVDGMGMPAPVITAPISKEGQPAWQVPPGWQEISGGQFLIAKFSISGDAGAQAAVNVSTSAGDGGGLAANVNRWRKQLGLGELSEAEISKLATSLDVTGGKATLVDLTGMDARNGQPTRLIGAIVPQTGQTWFYKLMGDAKLVGAQQPVFEKFIQSVKY